MGTSKNIYSMLSMHQLYIGNVIIYIHLNLKSLKSSVEKKRNEYRDCPSRTKITCQHILPDKWREKQWWHPVVSAVISNIFKLGHFTVQLYYNIIEYYDIKISSWGICQIRQYRLQYGIFNSLEAYQSTRD